MAAIAQTIAIVDRSGKVVGTSKQLKNVFKEAKTAYLERKAEIVAERRAREERELRKAIKAMSVAEESAMSRSQTRQHGHREIDGRRPSAGGRHHSGTSVRSGYSNRSSISDSPRSRASSISPQHSPVGEHNDEMGNSRSMPTSPVDPRRSNELIRRRTDMDLAQQPHRSLSRSYSATELDQNVDMDLAYGDFHPEHLALAPRVEERLQKQELSSLVTKCKMLLDEANCAQHSVKAIVSHLQKNPDAMAAVALTLAEISNIVSKMAPGALTALRAGAPTVFAMLAAPEFLIAVGVGVGITVVMFGGYKIIKKIRARQNGETEGGMDEMLEVGELDRIEHWRRGIADSDTMSVATSVEGEYITPMAAASMGHLPDQGRSRGLGGEERKSKDRKEKKHRSSRRGGDEISEVSSERSRGSRRSEKSSRSSSGKLKVPGSEGPGGAGGKDRAVVKVKKPSPLRRMFTSRDTNSTVSG